MITLLYFAKIKEELGIASETLGENFDNTLELKRYLCSRGKKWQTILMNPSTQIAINQQLSSWQDSIPQDAEIAIFPPITGG